jgi:hypothetical protein
MPSRLHEIAGPPSPARSRLAELEAAPEASWLDSIVTGGLRTVPSILGSLGLGAAGAVAGIPALGVGAIGGGIAGGIAGGAAGGALGEGLAQAYERHRGLRKDYSPAAIGIETVLGGVPLGKSATLVKAGLKGAGMNVAGTQMHTRAETGQWADAPTTAKSALLGFAFGAGGEKGGRILANRKAAREASRLAELEPDLSGFEIGPLEPARSLDADRFDADPRVPDYRFREYDPLDVAARSPIPPRPIEADVRAMREVDDEIAERLAAEDLPTYPAGRYKGTAPVVGGSRLREVEDALATDTEFNTDQFYERIRAGSNFDQHLVGEAARDSEAALARAAREAEGARTQSMLDEMEAMRESDTAFAERQALEEMPTYPMRERGIPETGWRAPQQIGDEIAGNQQSANTILREQMYTGDFRNADAPQRAVPDVAARATPEPDSLTDFLAMQERASGPPARQPLDPQYAQQLERMDTVQGARQSGIGDYLDADAEIARNVAAREAAEPFEDIAGRMRAERAARFEAPRYPPPPPRAEPWEVRSTSPADEALRALIPERLLSQRGDVASELASGIGGGVVGGLYGATQGEDTDDRIRNALLMGTAGAAGGAGLTRILSGGRLAGEMQQAMPRTIPERSYPTATGGAVGKHMASARVLEFDPNAGPKPPVQEMPRAQRENLGLDKFQPEQRDTIQSLIDEYGTGPLESQRRGRQSTERTNWLAQAMTVPAGRKLAPGTNLTAEGHVAYGNAVASVQDQLREVAQRIKQTGGTEADLLKQAELLEAHKVLFFSYAGLRTEAGRALNVYKAMKEALPSELRLVREMLDRGRLRGDMADLADVLANLPKDPRAAMKALRAAQTRTKMEAFGSYFTANILSGVATQERNFLGNAARMFARVAEKAAISRIDPLRAMLAGQAQGTRAAKYFGSPERQIFTGEALQEARGMAAGLSRAVWDAASTMRHGFSIDATMSGLKNITPLTIPRKEFGGGGLNPLNIPGRTLEGVDRFFRNLNHSAELYALTYAQARRELGTKANDGALAQRVAELRANPSQDLQRRAARSAEAAVFQNEAGPALKMLEAIKNHIPALQILIPFVRTPAKIYEQGLKRTPAGALMSGMRSEDARDQAMHFGEMAAGTAVGFPLAWLAATGQVTGAGPTDPQKRQALMERGWRPNSVNVSFLPDALAQKMGAEKSDDGSYWVNYQLLQPYAVPLSIVANAFEAWEEEGAKGGAADAVAQTIMRVGRSALDQSFLSGLSDFFDALNDPGRAAEQFFGRTASGVIPMSGALRSVARHMDPVVRQPETWGEHIQAGIPGMSDELTPKLTRFGEDVRRQGSPFIVPEVSGVNLDPINEELSRIGLDIGSPSDRLESTRLMRMLGIEGELEPKDMLDLQRLRGRTARTTLAAVMGAPGYENLPDEVRAELLSRMLRKGSTKVNKVARAALIAQQPDLIRLLGDPMAEAAAKTYGK